jgi:L-amino acid N-acyltransferase YncA
LKKQGVQNAFAVIHDANIASIKSFSRAGFAETARTVSLGPFTRKKDA